MIKVSEQRSMARRVALVKAAAAFGVPPVMPQAGFFKNLFSRGKQTGGSTSYWPKTPFLSGVGRGLPKGPIAPELKPSRPFSPGDPYWLQGPFANYKVPGATKNWYQGGLGGVMNWFRG